MSPPFASPSSSGSRFVAINPNIDTLGAVTLAEGSPDILFAVFGQGSASDFDALLVHAQESLAATSAINCHRAWIVLHSNGTVGHEFRFPVAQYARV
jgi:hypothetical protein